LPSTANSIEVQLQWGYEGSNIDGYERIGELWVNGVKRYLSSCPDLTDSYVVHGALDNELNAYQQATGDYPSTEQELQNSQYFSLYWVGLHHLGNKITIHQNVTPKRIDGINIFDTIG